MAGLKKIIKKTAANDTRREGFWSLLTANLFGFRGRPRNIKAVFRRMNLTSWSNRLALFLVGAAVIGGLATYGALTAVPPFGKDPHTVIWLLDTDLVILLLLTMLIARLIVKLWMGRRQGLAGSRLHTRLVFIFSFLATAPAIIMTVFATFFLHFGVQSWFSDRVRSAVTESQAVAQAYLEEHIQTIRADILGMANDLDRQAGLLKTDPVAARKILQTQSMIRNLPQIAIFDSSGRIWARVGLSVALELATIPQADITSAEAGNVAIIAREGDDRVRALVKLNNFQNSYLYVGRSVDPIVLAHVTDTRAAVKQYELLESERSGLQVKITMIFIVVALLLLFVAIWFSLMFSRQLITPVSALIAAADRVRSGDLTARVPEVERQDEFEVLAYAFNRMTSQIQEQHRLLDQRRRFTEAVLAGVSSGIVGVDEEGRITLANTSAEELFSFAEGALTGRIVTSILPGLGNVLAQAQQKSGKITQAELPYDGSDGVRKTLLVRIAIEQIGEQGMMGAVLTFDDITELQSVQRKAAWADVARRIAHEIKNPLTPIQLSAERLKRKYLKQISDDPETFAQCTDTIIDHVGDIGRMVNEFSAFARMPEPVMKRENLARTIRDLLTLQQQAHRGIQFNLIGGAHAPVMASFDVQQIRQAFTNIVQNAIDSISSRREQQKDSGERSATGRIDVLISERPGQGAVVIAVTDNGLGLPKNEDPARLTDPYVTHKEKGTGLGLAIVKKIMEDHKGRVVLGTPDWLKALPGWQDRGGASVSLILPVDGVEENTVPPIEQKKAIS